MIFLISGIKIFQLSKLLLNNPIGLCGQIELLDFDEELINFIQIIIASEISWLASSSTHGIFLERHDLIVVIVLYLFKDISNGISSLLLVKSVVSVRPLHELLNSVHFIGEYFVEPSQTLVEAINLQYLLSLFSALVSYDKCNQEQQSDWLVFSLVNADRVVH